MKSKGLSLLAILAVALWVNGCQPQGSPDATKQVEEQGAKIESLEKRMTQLESDLQTQSTKMDEMSKKIDEAMTAASKEPTKVKKIVK